MLIRACTVEDVPALERSLPSYGTDVHATFVAPQTAGEVGYLAWHGGRQQGRDAVALGSVLIRSAGDREGAILVRQLSGTPDVTPEVRRA